MALGNLASRFLVAVVSVPVVLLTLYVDPPEPTWALVFIATLLAAREFFGMTLADRGDRIASLVIAGASAAALYWLDPRGLHFTESKAVLPLLNSGPMIAFVLAVIPTGLYYLFRFGEIPTVAARFTATVTGVVYVALTMTFLALCKRDWEDGAHVVVLILLIAWVGDTGAYFAGRFLGKKKLYEAVSPKKTWAGALGGLAGSTAGAVVMKLLFLDELSWLDVFLIAVPGAILGQLGDLAESLFKRAVGVKDSGSLLPGHGGMLDRIDAVLFIGPYVYLYLQLFADLAPRG
jgi:phosphatidate cytidylyltransferase